MWNLKSRRKKSQPHRNGVENWLAEVEDTGTGEYKSTQHTPHTQNKIAKTKNLAFSHIAMDVNVYLISQRFFVFLF